MAMTIKGERYLPIVLSEWLLSESYEYLTIVPYQGRSYISRKDVPAGTAINNRNFWAVYSDKSIEVEALLTKIGELEIKVNEQQNQINALQNSITELDARVTALETA